jgi:hypothetical protein
MPAAPIVSRIFGTVVRPKYAENFAFRTSVAPTLDKRKMLKESHSFDSLSQFLD